MIETVILAHLDGALSVPVALEVPEERPASYVVFEKIGSQRQNRLDSATIALQSIAPSLYEAALLNEAVKAAMDQLPQSAPEVFGAELERDYNFTDTATKERRYQAIYNITYKE